MKLIDKDAVVAEIERLACQEYNSFCDKLLDYIDTLEVKEVDLEKEINNFGLHYDGIVLDRKELIEFAKHFFELGLQVSNKVQKGE